MALSTNHLRNRMVKNSGDYHPPEESEEFRGPTTEDVRTAEIRPSARASAELHKKAEEAGVKGHHGMDNEQIMAALRAIEENKH